MRIVKPAADRIVAGVALAVLTPLLVIVAVGIRHDDGSPSLFRQQRVGRNGKPFQLLKFRSMRHTTDPSMPSGQAGNAEVTRLGRLLRRTNVDELPQIINILRGEMSFVGPRPALPGQTELLRLRRCNGASRLVPGLSGLAQVEASDGMSEAEKAWWDGEYAAHVCLATDLGIVARTVAYLRKPPPRY